MTRLSHQARHALAIRQSNPPANVESPVSEPGAASPPQSAAGFAPNSSVAAPGSEVFISRGTRAEFEAAIAAVYLQAARAH
jgi:hypothetical protein